MNLFNTQLKNDIHSLQKENADLKLKLDVALLEKEQAQQGSQRLLTALDNLTPTDFIVRILQRGVAWYDYKALDHAGQMNYWGSAQALLNNEVFNNELNALKADLMKYIALDSRTHEETMSIRTAVVNLEAFKDRVQAIENPNREVETDTVNEAI